MIETADKHGFTFDTVQMPVNALDEHYQSFCQNVIPQAQKRGMAVLGMKPLSNGAILKTGTITAPQALHYAMSVPVTVTITGCQSMANLEQALSVARNFQPMTREQKLAVLERRRRSRQKDSSKPTSHRKFTTARPTTRNGWAENSISPADPAARGRSSPIAAGIGTRPRADCPLASVQPGRSHGR